MSIKVGEFIFVKTKTVNNTFGDVVYKCIREEIMEPTKEKGFYFEMVSGTGILARAGYGFPDSLKNIEEGLKSGVIKRVDASFANGFNKEKNKGNALLGIEMD